MVPARWLNVMLQRHTSTNRRSQLPGPPLLSTKMTMGFGGTHSTRLYWMLMRPDAIGLILLYVSAWEARSH